MPKRIIKYFMAAYYSKIDFKVKYTKIKNNFYF